MDVTDGLATGGKLPVTGRPFDATASKPPFTVSAAFLPIAEVSPGAAFSKTLPAPVYNAPPIAPFAKPAFVSPPVRASPAAEIAPAETAFAPSSIKGLNPGDY